MMWQTEPMYICHCMPFIERLIGLGFIYGFMFACFIFFTCNMSLVNDIQMKQLKNIPAT